MRLHATRLAAIAYGRGLGNPLWDLAGERPSLDLRFAESKSLVDAVSGQSLITFTRASSGTYVGSDGLLKTATTDEPRFDHNPLTGESLGLLVEEQRTNLLLRSEEFGTTWIPTNLTISANAVIAPDGTLTADKLIETIDNGVHAITQGTVTPGVSYVFSVYAKAGERTRIQLSGLGAEGQGFFTDYNLSTGVVSSAPPGSQMIPVGNGWYRCTLVITASSAAGAVIRIRDSSGNNSYTGDGTSGIYIWGAQLEAGAFPTSYIPTTASAVTRSADVASITGANFSSWYRQAGGTLYSDFTSLRPADSQNAFAWALEESSSSYIAIRTAAGYTPDRAFPSCLVAGSTEYSGESNAATGYLAMPISAVRSALAYEVNDFAHSWNSQASFTDNSGALPTPTLLAIGNTGSVNAALNGPIRRLTYWPQRLSNNVLQSITQ